MSTPIARQLSDTEIENAIRGAFQPLRCGVETNADYGNQVLFTVHLPNGKEFPYRPGKGASRPDTAPQLHAILIEARRQIEAMGFKLHEWSALDL